MAWRVIMRIGLTYDTGSVVRNTVVEPILNRAGIYNTITGTWEGAYVDHHAAAAAIADLLPQLAAASIIAGADPTVLLKHIWLYIDPVDDHTPGTPRGAA